LFGLVDGRSRRKHRAFESLDPEVRRIAEEQVDTLDGSRSDLNLDELFRRTVLAVKAEGLFDLQIPERTLRRYLTHLKKQAGATTRRQRSNRLRGSSAFTSFPALRPGQIVAIDVTRADNLVWDQWSQKAISVEIITALDVATRVVLAVRVVPRSADAHTAGLILYDVLRPFSMSSRFRVCGGLALGRSTRVSWTNDDQRRLRG
jgi:putative transposase